MTHKGQLGRKLVGLLLAAALAACGGGGGGGGGGAPAELPAMVDSLGRPVAEADFGAGDAAAAGADGTAFDLGPMASAEVTVTDATGTSRSAVTDSSGYYRVSIKGLAPPFVAKVKRGDASQWVSASAVPVRPRGFVTINLSGLTDKTVGYVADAANIGAGAASAVTPAVLVANPAALNAATARIRAGLAAPLTNAGLDPSSYDPVSTPLAATGADKHALFLQGLRMVPGVQGRTGVVGLVAGAPSAVFRTPAGLAVDASGNVLVADQWNHVIRKISPDGTVTTLAGTGEAGFTNGSRATASFNQPVAVAADARGNVYVAEDGNHAVRKISASGTVTTLFTDGPSVYGPGALAVDPAGNLYVADRRVDIGSVRKVTPEGVVSMLVTPPAQPCCASAVPGDIFSTLSIATDTAGNLYVVGGRNFAIVRIAPDGTRKELPAPSTPFIPEVIAVAADGTIYATAWLGGYAVWFIKADGLTGHFAGGQDYGSADGIGAAARFSEPYALAMDPGGNLFVTDRDNGTIRKITPAREVTTIAGKRTGFMDGAAASFSAGGYPSGLGGLSVAPDGSTLLADTGNHAIRRISPTGLVTTLAGNGAPGFSNGTGRAASFNGPRDVATDASGNIYVADTGNRVVRKITASGEVSTFAGTGAVGLADGDRGAATFTSPVSVAVGTGGDVYVADSGRIRRIDTSGNVTTVLAKAANALELSSILSANPGGPVYFHATADCCDALFHFTEALFSFSPGAGLKQLTGTFSAGRGPAVDGSGNLYSVRNGDLAVRLTPAGVETRLLRLDYPQFNTFRSDRDGNLFLADGINAVVKVVLP